MKLLYMPQGEAGAALLSRLSAEEKLLYCLPYDRLDGAPCDGHFAVTDRQVLGLSGEKLLFAYPLAELSRFMIEEYVGLSSLLCEREGVTLPLCAFTRGPRERAYRALLPLLARLLEGGESGESDAPSGVCPRCGRPLPPGRLRCPLCADHRHNYRCLWETTKGQRTLLLLPLFAMAVSLLIRFLVPSIQKTAINEYIYPANGVQKGPYEQFLVLILSLIALELISRLLSVAQSYLSGLAGTRYSVRLRRVMFDKVHSLSLSSIDRHSIGHLTQRINGDVSTVGQFIVNRLPALLSQLLGLLIGTVLILAISPTMSLLIFSPIPFLILFLLAGRRMLTRWANRARCMNQRYHTRLYDYIAGGRVIKAFGKEGEIRAAYRALLDKHTEVSEKRELRVTLFALLALQFYEIGSYLLLFFGNLWLFWGQMDVGTINQFTAYSVLFYEPLRAFTDLPAELSAFGASLGQLTEILDEEPEIVDAETPVTPDIQGGIEINNLTFGYTPDTTVFRNLSLSIREGEMIGLVGHSGCGKSTLVNLIMRIYEAKEGEILIDGVDIKRIPQKYLRSHIGIVPQETQLFDGTVRENILYSKPTAGDEEIIEAARIAGAHDFIMSLPEGYNTEVGDRGYMLSGGERQRVAIARALLHDPRILILDEATAALDTETEKQIQEALDRLTKGRTTIAIAHRLSTLRNADRIVVLEGGRVLEEGTHRELLEQRGRYYRLVSAQAEAALGNDAILQSKQIMI